MKSLLRVVFQFDPESLPTPRSESDLVEDPRTALYRRLKRRPWVNSEGVVEGCYEELNSKTAIVYWLNSCLVINSSYCIVELLT